MRVSSAQREILQVFAAADGHGELTPVLREALAFYIHARLRHGREHVRVEVPVQVGQ